MINFSRFLMIMIVINNKKTMFTHYALGSEMCRTTLIMLFYNDEYFTRIINSAYKYWKYDNIIHVIRHKFEQISRLVSIIAKVMACEWDCDTVSWWSLFDLSIDITVGERLI